MGDAVPAARWRHGLCEGHVLPGLAGGVHVIACACVCSCLCVPGCALCACVHVCLCLCVSMCACTCVCLCLFVHVPVCAARVCLCVWFKTSLIVTLYCFPFIGKHNLSNGVEAAASAACGHWPVTGIVGPGVCSCAPRWDLSQTMASVFKRHAPLRVCRASWRGQRSSQKQGSTFRGSVSVVWKRGLLGGVASSSLASG